MGSRVNVCSVNILDNPSPFDARFKLEITFEVFENLPNDLEWELVYVGSAETSTLDQLLDSVLVGPVPEGRHKFVFEADAPDVSKIPESEIVGVTVLLLRCKYKEQEFINLGWFVSNEYTDPELKENPPAKPQIDKLSRTIQTDDVRVTAFPIKWDENAPDEYPPEEEVDENTEVTEAAVVSSTDAAADDVPNLVGEDEEMPESVDAPVAEPVADTPNTEEEPKEAIVEGKSEDGTPTVPLTDVTNDAPATA